MSRLGALCACAALAGCVRQSASGGAGAEPAVDRSNGTIPELSVHRAQGVIAVDGRLDEPAWARAVSTGGFVHPGSGRDEPGSSVHASARMLWDDRALYVGVTVWDGAPVAPFARDAADPHLWERSSAVELMLQPGDPGDNRAYFEVQTDTAGAVWDTRFDDYNAPQGVLPTGQRSFGHQEWSAQLERAAQRAPGRYTLEFALPWSAITAVRTAVPPATGARWRANLYSFRDGQRDSLAWSPLLGQGNFHRASRFGVLVFSD